ncbi:MAG TPA: ABC-F family ATP-binding cassette domain-containing protein [Gemmatimonadaceae bacterium]|nr:ABC-F family ATP-binding cassette domain-containing protein [Gemmatimonadaceae bacterium]
MTQISVSGAGVQFGATTLFRNVTFTVAKGERWGIVGRNGTGKTTLFKLITGQQQPTFGVISKQPGLRVSLLEQHRDFGDANTVWAAAAGQFSELLALEQSLADQSIHIGELGEASTPAMLARYDRDLERFEREGGYTFAPRVDAVLHGLGFDPVEARTRPLTQLSGGERGRLGLARQLVSPAEVLLLDEPTNHLDLDTTQWLENYLQSTDKTILLISHDRAFLASVVDHVLHFEGDSAFAYSGSYESFVRQREEKRLSQQRAFEKQQRFVADQEDYVRRNLAGQNSRQAKGRRKLLSRLPRLSPPIGSDGSMALRLDIADRGGDQVVVAKEATVAVDDRPLIENFTGAVKRGDILGLLGPNGTGKSTLLRTLVGDHELSAGDLRLGGSIRAAYYRQDLSQVPMDRSIYDVIADLRPLWERRQVQSHLARFGFSGDEVQRSAATMSGGERARVALAMIVLVKANLLILDEPTNHLDVESIEALEDALDAYDGTIILVSHDRELLRALVDRVWVLHDRRITDFPGTFEEWEIASRERAHAAAVNAAEEEALRRVHEKKKTKRQEDKRDKGRDASRNARLKAEEAERRVTNLESRIATLTTALANPELYTTIDGKRRAVEHGKELEALKKKLDDALEDWTTATQKAEEIVGEGARKAIR